MRFGSGSFIAFLIALLAFILMPAIVVIDAEPEYSEQEYLVYDYYLPAIMVQAGPEMPVEAPIADGYHNVKAYGAVGDGVADDTQAIQETINQNNSIYLPSGTYLLTDTLTFPTDVPYQSADDNRSYHVYGFSVEIVWNGEDGGTMMDLSTVGSGTIIEGITFVSEKENVTGIYAGKDFQWGMHKISDCRFKSLYKGVDGGSLMRGSNFAFFDSTIENSVFYNCDIGYDSFGSGVRIIGTSFISNDVAININEVTENPYNKSSIFGFGLIFAGNGRDIYVNSTNSRIHSFSSSWFETSQHGIVTVSEGTRRLNQGLSFYGCLFNSNNENVMDFTNLDFGAISIYGSQIYGANSEIIVPDGIVYSHDGLTLNNGSLIGLD
mgnify:CR=1 FL=1